MLCREEPTATNGPHEHCFELQRRRLAGGCSHSHLLQRIISTVFPFRKLDEICDLVLHRSPACLYMAIHSRLELIVIRPQVGNCGCQRPVPCVLMGLCAALEVPLKRFQHSQAPCKFTDRRRLQELLQNHLCSIAMQAPGAKKDTEQMKPRSMGACRQP